MTYFVPDPKKQGGKYVTVEKTVRRVDEVYHKIIFEDRSEIRFEDVIDILL